MSIRLHRKLWFRASSIAFCTGMMFAAAWAAAKPPITNPMAIIVAEDDNPPARHVGLEIENPRPIPDVPESPIGARSISLSYTAWTAMGPGPLLNSVGSQSGSGRIAGVAGHPTDANTIYIAASGGGVWKTVDGGTSWLPLTDSLPTCSMGAIAIAPSNPDVVYVGSGEANNSADSYYGRGVYKSTNAGATWTVVGATQFDRRAISAIAVDPTNADILYVAVQGAVNGLAGNRGIWKSPDGGVNWTNTTTSISAGSSYTDVVIDPSNTQIVYAAVGTYSGAGINGVYKTTNGGTSWAIAGDFPTGDSLNGRIRVAIAPSSPQTLYAAITHASTFGLYKMMKTTNGGTNWVQLAATPNYMNSQGWYDTTLIVSPTNADNVFAGGASSTHFIESTDGGASWSNIQTGVNGNGPHVDHHGISFDANGKLLDGNDGGIWRLDNATVGSILWTSINGDINTIQFTGITLHPTNADIAYGGSQDNGTEKFTGSLPWAKVRGGDGGFVRVDPATPTTVYHSFQRQGAGGTAGVNFLERSDNSGSTWVGKTSGITSTDPCNFYMPYEIDPSNPTRLLVGTNRVYETTNSGDSWSPISTPSTAGWVGNTTIDSIGIAPSDINTIYATAGGRLFVTTDRGVSWNARAPLLFSHCPDIVVDPTDANIAYIVRDSFGGVHVYRTTNAGVNWTSISGTLPDLPVYTVALDPKGPGSADDVIYVGADVGGVYRSTDLGTTWSLFGTALPSALVVELHYNATLGILGAATHGRGMWEILITSVPTISKSNESTACGSTYTSAAPSVAPSTPAPAWSLLSGPPGMTIDASTGAVTWPNPIASATDYTVNIQATNPAGSSMYSWTLTVKPGDFDGDGVCSDLDTAAFVDHLLGLSVARPCAADVNLNGVMDALDIPDYVLCRLSGP